MESLTITRPDDWHLHLRDGAAMRDIVTHSARQFARAIIMPNLRSPVTTTRMALEYRERIRTAIPGKSTFSPLMTLYLTDNTPAAEIGKAKDSGHVFGIKLYPAGATTNSDAGVTDLACCFDTLEEMARLEMPLLVHGEVVDDDVDVFDRETVFIDRVLAPLHERLPDLKIVFEHVTTARAVEFVNSAANTVAATVTPQHLLYNRNALFRDGLRPHYYCLPVLKPESDREALLDAATGGSGKFFLGTDSAPHSRTAKESSCGCAGIFSAPVAMALYAEAFERAGKLENLDFFAGHAGADFYGLPRNQEKLRLQRKNQVVPKELPFGDSKIVPFRAGETLSWSLQ